MNRNDSLGHLLSLPREFLTRGSVSMFSLLEETGYFAFHDSISEDEVRMELHRHPEVIAEWLQYSEDKRTDDGWYVRQKDNHSYIVGHFPDHAGEATLYVDALDACAHFVKLELEDIHKRSIS